jgi:hypothetical protein
MASAKEAPVAWNASRPIRSGSGDSRANGAAQGLILDAILDGGDHGGNG